MCVDGYFLTAFTPLENDLHKSFHKLFLVGKKGLEPLKSNNKDTVVGEKGLEPLRLSNSF